jgi:hypothetical protein
MPESIVRKELESLNIRVQGVAQLRFGHCDQDPTKDCSSTPHFIVSVAQGPEVSKVPSVTELCGLQVLVELYVAPKGPMQCKRCQRFGHMQRNCGYAPRCVACGGSHLYGGCCILREQPQCCGYGGNHTANYWDCIKWEEVKVAVAKQATKLGRNSAATGDPATLIARWAGPSAEQMDLGEGWNHVRRGMSSRPLPHHSLIQILLLSRSWRRLSSQK